MPLQLDVEPIAAEHADQAIEQPADAVAPAVERRAAGERDEPARRSVELLERERALAFRRAQLHAGDRAGRDCDSPPGLRRGREENKTGRAGEAGRAGERHE